MRYFAILTVFLLSACGGGPTREVSRAGDYTPSGMTYDEFRNHPKNDSDSLAAQKRFITLDRNNDGRLSEAERGNF